MDECYKTLLDKSLEIQKVCFNNSYVLYFKQYKNIISYSMKLLRLCTTLYLSAITSERHPVPSTASSDHSTFANK